MNFSWTFSSTAADDLNEFKLTGFSFNSLTSGQIRTQLRAAPTPLQVTHPHSVHLGSAQLKHHLEAFPLPSDCLTPQGSYTWSQRNSFVFSNGLKPSCGRGLFLESWRHMCCTVLCLVAQSCLTLCDAMDHSPPGSSVHGDSPGKNTGMDCHALLQGIFPTQGSNPNLLHCSQILYHLNHLESPRILEWVTYPFSWGSSWPRNQTGVSCIAGGFFTSWAIKEVPWRHMRMPTIYTI